MRQLLLLAAACGSSQPSSPGPAPAPPPTATAPAAKQPPPNTRGACRDNPKVAHVEDRFQPQAIAACPDVLEMSRGDGVGKTTGAPAIAKAATPDWDLAAMRDYACAYACAPGGSTASLLAWSALEDERPLRNHYAA